MEKQTEIIFIRHGETDFNKARLFFGHLDPELNETGRKQLENTGKILKSKEKGITKVFSSDLKRCVESTEILKIDKNINIAYSSQLREINFGVFEGKTYEEIKEEFPGDVEKMKTDWKNFRAEKGESLCDVMKRSVNKVEKIIKSCKNEKIVIVAHSGVIQTLLSHYLFGNLDGYWKFKVDNGSLTKMKITENGYAYFEYVNFGAEIQL